MTTNLQREGRDMKDEELMVYIRILKKWKHYTLVCCSEKGDPKPSFAGFMEYLCNLYDIEEDK